MIPYSRYFFSRLTVVSSALVLSSCASKETKTSNDHDHGSITKAEVVAAQTAWGAGIVAIGDAYQANSDYTTVANSLINELYAYDDGTVLFKPTLAADEQFRLSQPEALSYFVTGLVDEDKGFAIRPWSAVRFENADIKLFGNSAIAMGNYFFTDENTGEDVKVEYTFGYHKNDQGELVINTHHSSLPYSP